MRRLTGIVAILLLLTAAAPVMACLTNVVMSHEESACCQAMHGQCGHMEKMGCCRPEVRADESPDCGYFPGDRYPVGLRGIPSGSVCSSPLCSLPCLAYAC